MFNKKFYSLPSLFNGAFEFLKLPTLVTVPIHLFLANQLVLALASLEFTFSGFPKISDLSESVF